MTASGHTIIEAARGWIGTPFAWGQSAKGVGCDCKGLVAGVARELDLPGAGSFEANFAGYGARVRPDVLKAGMVAVFDRARDVREGAVLLLKVAGRTQHLAIYAGQGRMIHCYSAGPMRVIEVPMGHVWARAVDSIWNWRGGDVPSAVNGGNEHGR
ncbi:NlpC/P60 family protein [Croceicoccus gelatinilyticus]|uniref:NlpC/P60 family protein n=1 Tax=Croceicoccus gelatinilyticus TaxID=2835536 RepID=UPI001BCBC5D0|nr:NlpC/P60 family protein [Croceicoccus gelatinilyticus]MBS7669326.1 C40 family peptidase [Croceicoccus gelatinilyticus]